MKSKTLLPAVLAGACFTTAHAAPVVLLPGDVNGADTNTTSFNNADLTLTPLQGSTPVTFNGGTARLGIDNTPDIGSPTTNANAFNDPDTNPNNGNEEKLRFEFEPTAGLTGITWDFSRADGPGAQSGLFISGFASDPLASLGGTTGGSTVSYAAGVLTIKVGYVNTGADTILTLANPNASAGATLLLQVGDQDQAGAQLAVTSITYEDDVPPVAPSILSIDQDPGTAIADVATTLTADIDPATSPAPTFLWEYDNGGGFAPAPGDNTSVSYTFTAGPSTDGSYRVTATNTGGSDAETIVITSTDDGDGVNNQWEIDNFGDHLLYGATDDVDLPAPDGLDNLAEYNAGTDPNDPDTDGDGLLDGAEAPNNANPLVADSDGDGYSDGYEVNTSLTAANDPNSTPGVDSGRNSIGITFASTAGDGAGVNLSPLALAGAPGYVQKNWNVTGSFANAPLTATEADVTAPSAGLLVDSSGATTSTGVLVEAAGAFSRLNNQDIPYGGLYSGYLFADATNDTVMVQLSDIPYSRYDVVIYTMGFASNVRGIVTDVTSGTEYTFSASNVLAQGEEPDWYRSADQSAVSNGSAENYPIATHVVFRGLSGSTQDFDLLRVADNGGIAAIQIVEDLDSDNDGMGDNYEISVGLSPTDDGTTDPVKEGANGDFDGDGILNIDEHDDGTNPTAADSDGDGYDDDVETDSGIFNSTSDTGTDPRINDTDGDGLLDGVETNTGILVDANDTGTNPLVAEPDFDEDGWTNAYEINTGLTDPLDPESPGGPNPNGFAIAFNAVSGSSQAAIDTVFGPAMYAGAPGVAQKNWNRTADLVNTPADASGDTSDIASPSAAQIVDSSGAATAVGVTFTAGRGAYSGLPETVSPYGRLFNSFIFGTTATTDPSWNPNASINLSGIPYSSYDVYVYFGSEFNGRTGTIGSTAAGTTYSFTTQVNSGSPGGYLQTTDTGSGNPLANYAVFSGQSSSTFDVTATVVGGPTLGIYGIQVVDTSGAGGPLLTLTNPQKSGSVFTADFTTDTAGTFIFERSQTLTPPWTPIGSAFSVSPGTSQVTDPAAPAGKAFYRVREQ